MQVPNLSAVNVPASAFATRSSTLELTCVYRFTISSISGEYAVFEVLVDGFVMEEETREHALTQFYSLKGVDRSHLGTFVAHNLAKKHGGSLQIESLPEEGSTRIVVKVPVARPAGLQDKKDSSTQDQLAREWEDDSE